VFIETVELYFYSPCLSSWPFYGEISLPHVMEITATMQKPAIISGGRESILVNVTMVPVCVISII
jgi:hypothetical protein